MGDELFMKNILFHGDSNTWGFDPGTNLRYLYELRWMTLCVDALGPGYNCIPSGMNGGTTMFDNPISHFVFSNPIYVV